jgi:mRNA-decapping enzyme subunit 2
MLDEAMEEVVLVKGWKKSANWSFPRGKINKDESDLDCAVREVYEETGYDIRAAGLVKDEKEMKYIEVTMREQHMRLYVFRGVPKDTYFEPKTRKEISKIEWYKLTDLPTLKKARQHEGSGTDQPTLSANKFYMVAPFLNPLKKWIAQQRKQENRYSSHLAAPPMLAEEASTDEQEVGGVGARMAEAQPQAVSDLPEVSLPTAADPASHLKEILNIRSAHPSQPGTLPSSGHMPQIDTKKSNALLALLRSGPQGQHLPIPHTPVEQISTPPALQESPHISHVRSSQVDQTQPPPMFQSPPQNADQPPLDQFEHRDPEPQILSPPLKEAWQQGPHAAPYQRTGDPQFAREESGQRRQPAVPPASALPKLTNHTKALLDVFKSAPPPSGPSAPPENKRLLDLFSRVQALPTPALGQQNDLRGERLLSEASGQHRLQDPVGASSNPAPPRQKGEQDALSEVPSAASVKRPEDGQKSLLLGLFNQMPKSKPAEAALPPPRPPVELAATGPGLSSAQKTQTHRDELLLTLLRQGNQGPSRKASGADRPSPREGETSATISGPLNQPEFDAISRSARRLTDELGRNPLPANRTLYDPNQPTPVKILTRPEESRQQATKSPRGIKPPPKRTAKEKSAPKAPSRPFQPQILRRPQTSDAPEASMGPSTGEAPNGQDVLADTTPSPPALPLEAKEVVPPTRNASQTGSQRQTLLALFGGGLDTTAKATTPPGSSIVSPLTTSQMMTSMGEVPLSAIDPISTRTSRVGSLASIGSGPPASRGPSEKRHTGAENKAFLLGYLGRIANREN